MTEQPQDTMTPVDYVAPVDPVTPVDYVASAGVLRGKVLLQMVWNATAAALPELMGKAKDGLVDRRDPAVDFHVKAWGELIAAKKASAAYSAAQEPTAPFMEKKLSGFTVNYAYWVFSDVYEAWSYPTIAVEIAKAGLGTSDVRAWLKNLKQDGSELLKLVAETTFGAEVARNPRVFASHLMMYDLLEVKAIPVDRVWGKVTAFSELYNLPGGRDEVEGALPMMGQETYARALLGVSDGCPNRLHRKEAVVVSAWLRTLQGERGPFTRDQVYELLLQRISSFDDISSIQVPDAAAAKGRGLQIKSAIEKAAATADLEYRTKQQAEELRLAEEYVRTQEAYLDRLRKQREGEKNPQKLPQFDAAIKQQEATLQQARADLASKQLATQPAPVVPPVAPPVVVASTSTADQGTKTKQEDDDLGSNKRFKVEEKVVDDKK